MYTVKGFVGSEEKLRTYFAGCAFEKKPRVLFVTDEVLPDHITCFEYLDSIRGQRAIKSRMIPLRGCWSLQRSIKMQKSVRYLWVEEAGCY